MEIDPKYQGRINRMRNLKLYKGSTDEEIYEAIIRKETDEREKAPPTSLSDVSYNQRYRKLIDKLQVEYGVNMNESNDAETLKLLVQHLLQLDGLNTQIRTIQESPHISNDDARTLKNISDVQRSVVQSISELQTNLGISRKTRQDKQSDTVPAFIETLKNKAAEYWARSTIPVMCETCKIELMRYWENFPDQANIITAELTCPQCKQKTLHVR